MAVEGGEDQSVDGEEVCAEEEDAGLGDPAHLVGDLDEKKWVEPCVQVSS